MTHLVLLPSAEAHIRAAHAWYEEQRPGLGDEFLDELHRAFAAIERTPQSYPIVHRHVRRSLVRRFPYAVYFVVLDDELVHVMAVWHGRRAPISFVP